MANKKHIYFMPGLGAGSKIFENINLPKSDYEFHFLDWLIPQSIDESLENYTKRLCQKIEYENPILIGVSFGGIIVQEMNELIQPQKTIIISSVKNNSEFPKRMKFLKLTRAYKLIPARRISNMENFSKFGFGKSLKKKTELYNKYLEIKDEKYLNWAIFNLLHWNSNNSVNNIFHIHGSEDEIFPIKYIENCIEIKGGSHAMIITKAKRINRILKEII